MTVVVLCSACAAAPTGWQPQWQEQWQWLHQGDLWVRGLGADGLVVPESESGPRFRASLVNRGESTAEIRFEGFDQQVSIGPGELRSLDLDLAGKSVVLRAPPEVFLVAPRLGAAIDQPRTVVFIVVDTLREDHVTRELMPAVTDFFSTGTRWRQATANASWTLPSVASFFTSRPVLEMSSPRGDLIGIPEGLSTWAGELQRAGFIGAAFVANYSVAVLNGFGEGFSTYLVPDGHGGAPHPDAAWVVEGARKWMVDHRGEKSFVYLHLMDPHHPYRSHEDPNLEVPDLIPLAMRNREAEAAEIELLKRLYVGEVQHVDEVLAPFLAGLPDDALVVLTSDHGEGLGEHGCWGHGLNLYQESLNVPLMIRAPAVASEQVHEVVQLLDLGPTVLDLSGVQVPESMAGRSLLAGGSQGPVVSSTFGAGPLRWAWREGSSKLTLRMAAQAGLGAEARSKMEEGSPLAAGAFQVDLELDPGEERPRPAETAILERAGSAFADTAGEMVPGLQILVWNHPGPAEVELAGVEGAEVAQAWSGSAMTVEQNGGFLRLRCEEGLPLCALALSLDPDPEHLRLQHSSVLSTQAVETDLTATSLSPPDKLSPGLQLWLNPPRPLTVGGQEETLERLRALGYIQ